MTVIAREAGAFPLERDTAGVRAEAGTIAAMDGLRGISVAWIVLFHFTVLRDAAVDPWAARIQATPAFATAIAHGPFAVDLFFLISGFLLTLPWLVRARDGRKRPSTLGFYRRRVLRIVPAYYVHVLLLFVLVMPLLHGAAWWRSDLYVYLFNGIAHGAFLHNLTPLTSGSLGVNGALWTLAVEAQFYALLPIAAPWFVRAPWRTLGAAVAISAAWTWSAHHGMEGVVRSYVAAGRHWGWDEASIRRLLAIQLPAYLAHFALGAALARAWLLRRDAMPRWFPGAIATVSLAVLSAIAAGARPGAEHGWLVSLTAIGGIVLAAACARGAIADSLLARGPVAFLGRISYSTYLWHLPLLFLLQAKSGLAPGAFLPAYLASVVATGWISWRWIEQPFMRARARASASPPPAP